MEKLDRDIEEGEDYVVLYACCHCGKEYTTKSEVIVHVQEKHDTYMIKSYKFDDDVLFDDYREF